MATVVTRSGSDGRPRYDVRYRDPGGVQRKRSFARRSDATAYAATVEADKLRGSVPLAPAVADAIAAHLARRPAIPVTLPWIEHDGPPVTAVLICHTRERKAINRNYFNSIWHAALRNVGVEPGRQNGCHALRHFFASVLLDAGESIKVVSEHLGHTDPGFTLRTYTHVMPDTRIRSVRAIDAVFSDCAMDVPSGGSA